MMIMFILLMTLIGLKSFYSPILFQFREQKLANAQGLFDDVVIKGNFAYIAAGDSWG